LESSAQLNEFPLGSKQKVDKNAFDSEYLSVRVKADYSERGNTQSFTMNMKMVKDSALWVSISAFGLEAFRALITTDSFQLIDRLSRKYYVESIDYLERFTKQKFTLHQLQSVLLGNSIYPISEYSKENDELHNDHFVYNPGNIINLLTLTEGFRVKGSILTKTDDVQKIHTTYDEFNVIKKHGSIPTIVVLEASGEGRVINLNLNYVSINADKIDALPFTIPSKYNKGL
jgi:hypothetical protein